MANNENFVKHSSIFNYSAKTITAVDFIYILILFPSVEHPWLTAFLILLFALINVPTVKLSEKHNRNFMYYSLSVTLIPLFFIGLLSGSEAPGWLPAFSLIMATEIFFINVLIKRIHHICTISIVGLAQYLVGNTLFESIIILTTLIIFTLLTSNIIAFINKKLEEIEEAKVTIEELHQQTRSSIEYASMIQGVLIPESTVFYKYFSEHFAIWRPKDIVGGDIYLCEELRNEDELLLMVIDCTGHGVPGAFVTMLVKSIERQIVARIVNSEEEVSPAKILSIFNSSMKHLLKQEGTQASSNAGFDGGILYYNKADRIIKYAGAETALYYLENGELKTIKGDRQSIGYKKSDASYVFKEHTVQVTEGMKFYLTTDGYIDQTGGEKHFSFGKKRFMKLIKEHEHDSMADQQEYFLGALDSYQGDEQRVDDVTVIGFKI